MTMRVKDLGPCFVTFNSNDLGRTSGGVKFRYTEESKPVLTDQDGATEVDRIGLGVGTVEVEVPLARTTLAKLAIVIGAASYSGNRFRVRNRVGFSMYDAAKALVLTRMVDNVASTDKDDILTVFKAYPQMDIEFVYDKDGQPVAKVIFKAFPGTDGIIWQIGS